MKPLYMWAGGKSKMIPKYQETPGIPYSGYDTFVEPFFGGGAMMIHMAQHNPNIKRFVLNDVNQEIVNLYDVIKNDVSNFFVECDSYCEPYLILNKVKRKEYFYEVRKDYITKYPNWSATKEAATLYFLMKTAFNGIFQSTKEAKGRFCTPAGLLNHKDKVYDKKNVLDWSIFLEKVDIYSGDWKSCVNNILGRAFYFFDPPYRNSFTQYNQDFTDDKTLEVIEFSKEADASDHLVMYCNRDAGDTFYTDNKGQLDIQYYDITYTAGRRAIESDGTRTAKKAVEVLLHSRSLVRKDLHKQLFTGV
jgi:DNA adenine methylase